MVIVFILAAWVGLSTLVCLALVGAAARPMPHFTERGTSGHHVEADYDSSDLEHGDETTPHGAATFPSAYSVG